MRPCSHYDENRVWRFVITNLSFLVVKLGNDLVKPMMPFSLSHSNSHLSTMLPPLWPMSPNFSGALSPSGLEQNNPSLVIKSLQQ